MTDETLFDSNEGTTHTPMEESTPANDPVTELVGEGKKFKTVEDLAKGKREADAFIQQLQDENKAMRDALKEADNAEANLKELREELMRVKEQLDQRPADSDANTTDRVSEDDIRTLVAQTITETEKKRTTKQNEAAVRDDLIRYFGDTDKAKEAYIAKAEELGLTVKALNEMAGQSPSAVRKLIMGDAAPKSSGKQMTSDVNSQGFNPSGGQPKPGTKAYFDNIRKEKGRAAYFAESVQQAIMKAKLAGTYDE